MLVASGVRQFQFRSEQGRAGVAFSTGDRRFRLILPVSATAAAPPDSRTSQDAARRHWRQLSVLMRAKLDAVSSGIVTFDEEFLAYMVMPAGGTVFQATAPGIANAYAVAPPHA